MQIEKNVTSIMREMLADPERDWSNHIPFVGLTEKEFYKAEYLIRKHCKNANKREEVMKSFERWKKRYETGSSYNSYRQSRLKDFVWFLYREIGKNKTWATKTKIENEINKVLETEKFYELEKLFEPYEDMFDDIKSRKMYEVRCQEKHKKLLESFDSKEAKISEFLVEKN